MLQTLDGIAADGGVGGNHAIHAVALQRRRNHADLLFIEVGSDLHEHRRALAMLAGKLFAAIGNRTQQSIQRLVALQGTQILGVG